VIAPKEELQLLVAGTPAAPPLAADPAKAHYSATLAGER
jgi:hypothetical protein